MAADREGGGRPQAIGGQLIIPIAALLFTLYYFSTIISSPFEAQVAAFFVGTILLILVGLFLIKTVIRLKQGDAVLLGEGGVGSRSVDLKRLGLFALTLGFMLLIEVLGFTITTFLFLTSAILLLDEARHPARALGIAAAAASGGYLLFILAFETRFPAGPFETFMKSVLGG